MPVERLIYTDEMVEEERADLIDHDDCTGPSDVGPGTFSCHEALHMASHLEGEVARALMDHPTIYGDPEFFKAAHEAHNALWYLYQIIADKHLSANPSILGEETPCPT